MIFLLIPTGIFLLDFFVKQYMDNHKEFDKREEVCGGRLLLTKFYNKGAALNFLFDRPKLMRSINAAVAAGTAVLYVFILRKKGKTGLKTAIGMLLGGGCSNFFDRCTKGHVVDYFSFNVKNNKIRSIVFNISDLFIFLGAVLTVIFGSKEE